MHHVLPKLDSDGKYPWLNEGFDGYESSFDTVFNYFQGNIKYDSNASQYFYPGGRGDTPHLLDNDKDLINKMALYALTWSLTYVSSYDFGRAFRSGESECRSRIKSDAFRSYCNNLFNSWCGAPGSLSTRAESGSELARIVQTDSWIIGANAAIKKGAVSNARYQLQLILWKIKSLNPQNGNELIKQVLGEWKKYFAPPYNDVEYPGDNWIGEKIVETISSRISYNTFFDYVKNACNTHGYAWDIWHYSHWQDAPSYSDVWGDKVCQFINKIASPAGYYTNHWPNNSQSHSNQSSCFIASTCISVLATDKSGNKNILDKPICKISENDKVIGKDGRVGIHTDELVETKIENRDITIYGFNDEEPFFTEGHPFLTKDGWKSVNPKITKSENPFFKVSRLDVGDIVYKINPKFLLDEKKK
eukprot:501736_1